MKTYDELDEGDLARFRPCYVCPTGCRLTASPTNDDDDDDDDDHSFDDEEPCDLAAMNGKIVRIKRVYALPDRPWGRLIYCRRVEVYCSETRAYLDFEDAEGILSLERRASPLEQLAECAE